MNVTLVSNTGDFSSNTTGNFRVKLPKKISLDENWDVAMTNIQYPSSWSSSGKKLEGTLSFNYYFHKLNFPIRINLSTERFKNIHDLVKAVNLAIHLKGNNLPEFRHNINTARLRMRELREYDHQKFLHWGENRNYNHNGQNDILENPSLIPKPDKITGIVESGTILDKLHKAFEASKRELKELRPLKNIFSESMKLVYNNVTNHLEFHVQKSKKSLKTINTIEFDENLQLSLGFENSQTIVLGINVAENRVDTSGIESEFYVQSSIVKPQFVGNCLKPLLRIVSVNSEALTQTKFQEFTVLNYVGLATNEFDTIEIVVVNEFGETINFNFGKIILQLHFRQRNHA